jgi:hypothetical protein
MLKLTIHMVTKYILRIMFGERARGEKVTIPPPAPSAERTYTAEEFNTWCREVGFGNKYGTRGSFYYKNKVGSLR